MKTDELMGAAGQKFCARRRVAHYMSSATRASSDMRLLTATIARVGGRDASRVGLEKIEALALALREAWSAEKRFSANVGGARLRCGAKRSVRVDPEPARRKAARR